MHRPIMSLLPVLALLAALAAAPAASGAVRTTSTTPVEDLTLSHHYGFDLVGFESAAFLSEPGKPMLPYRAVHFFIPAGYRVAAVRARALDTVDLGRGFRILPAQRPVPIGRPELFSFTPPDPLAYGTDAPFPGRLAELVHEGSLSGYGIAAVALYPLQYSPATGALSLVSTMEVSLDLAPAAAPRDRVRFRGEGAERVFRRAVRAMVVNEEDVPERASLSTPEGGRGGTVEYLIVTDSSLAAEFQRLADWKTKKGVPTEVASTSWIYANYSGVDNQEKIRNCVKDYWRNKGLAFVLLGGDTGKVPYRKAYADGSSAGSTIPCDTYFSDLDGTWNDDGDNKWGEIPDDNIDAYSDVYVGRAPVDTVSETASFVDKILQYEGHSSMPSLPTDYQLKCLMIASWLDGSTNGAELKDKIEELWVPDRCSVTKLYESYGNLSPSSAVNAMNSGYNFINHDGHGSTGSIQAGTGYLGKSDMQNLVNAPRFSIFYSLSCYSAAFDSSDCIAEEFVKNANGGGAYVGNSRYGWYWPGMPESGYSASWDRKFWRAIYDESYDYWPLGQVHCGGKDMRIFKIWSDPTERFCFYELNLLGGAEMPVFKDTPETLTVLHPPTLPAGASDFPVLVMRKGDRFEGARVCLMKQGDLYDTAFTGADGLAVFSAAPLTTGTLDVTVTGHDSLPGESTAQVDTNPACPFATGVDPDWAFSSGGTLVTVTGYNFTASPAMTVAFDGVPCGTVTFVDEHTLTCLTPAVNGYGWKDVAVSSANGSSTLPGAMRFFRNLGAPFNDTMEDTIGIPQGSTVDLVIGGESLAPYYVLASYGPGPESTPFGICGLTAPKAVVRTGTLNSSGYAIESANVPMADVTFYLQAISTNGPAWSWAEGGNNPNGSGSIEVLVGEGSPPAWSWTGLDVGNVGIPGSFDLEQSTGTFTVNGSGSDIWGTADAFYFVTLDGGISGDGEMVARVKSVSNTNSWAKAGVMIRETLDPGSKHAMMVLTPGNGAAFQRRTQTGGTSDNTNISGITAPYWVKVVRTGDTLTGYMSADGSSGSWTAVGSATIPMAADVTIGLCVTSHDNGVLCQAVFDGVVVTDL